VNESGAEAAPQRKSYPWRGLAGLVTVGCLVTAMFVALSQVVVSVDDGSTARACGSAFDVMTDRSGWEVWWARDLDEPDPAVRAELVRTTGCPDALNQRVVGAVALGLAGLGLVSILAFSGPRRIWPADGATTATRLRRAGTVTVVIGSLLTVTGLVALVALLADADSTLFLYTDRLVVGLAGVIVLVPAIALALGGWVVRVVGAQMGDDDA